MLDKFINKNKTFIIAEAGVNHNGSLAKARELIRKAKWAGADAIKFQTFKADKLLTKNARLAAYQKSNMKGTVKSQYELIKKLEFSFEDFKNLKEECRKQKIAFISTPFDEESMRLLNRLKVSVVKVSSGDLTNVPFLETLADLDKWVLLSTGMANMKEVKDAVKVFKKAKNVKYALLHCVSAYPAPFKDVNLKAMKALRKAFKCPVGYSDHTLGIAVAIAAVARGAQIIEKHLTLDRKLPGPDHKASLEPAELKAMVEGVRQVELSLGDGDKRLMPSESKNRELVRKSVVALKDIAKGEKLTVDDITIKRPGHGIAPKGFKTVIGTKAKSRIKQDQVIQWEHLVQ